MCLGGIEMLFTKTRVERSHPPCRLSGEELWEQVRNLLKIKKLKVQHKKLNGYGVTHNWTKRSIFWDLPYWKDNLIHHNLDVMHIEKNIFGNVFHIMMDNKDRTKDKAKARKDLSIYCGQHELELKALNNGKLAKPKANFTFSLEQRCEICNWV
ncbi:hypothetical protein ACH5RR_033867 [Cinchona calisaya]|uniref:Uncharacterized protein n=1 Tax=Cinchona calisaya TaxID=153742 RepID=A0ABD2YBG4_9GENT